MNYYNELGDLAAATALGVVGEAEHPEEHLASWAGLMQADAYAGYDRLYEAGRRPDAIVEAACWAHARRKFFDLARINKAPIAIETVARIDALLAIERDINGLPPADRRQVRRERSRPRVEALGVQLPARRIRSMPGDDTSVELQDLGLQGSQLTAECSKTRASHIREPGGRLDRQRLPAGARHPGRPTGATIPNSAR